MQITKQFIEQEMGHLQRKMQEAHTFLISAESAIAIYKMLLERLEKPEPEAVDLQEMFPGAEIGEPMPIKKD
jgi:hypothetical protein